MKFGHGFPLVALDDVARIRDFAQTLDGAGFDYITAAGHLLSSPADRYQGRPPATYAGPYHDPFVLFAYLAGITQRLEFMTSILILPLYETAVVAKQAAELAFLSNNRFHLGVGLSWQEPEYEALNQDIHTRGRRLQEQVEVLRLLWTQPYVTFKGRWHNLDQVGLNRLPSQPIPIWFGTSAEERPMRRAASVGDGYMPMGDPAELFPRIQEYMVEQGRDGRAFMLMTRLTAGDGGPDSWTGEAKRLQGLGVTHLTIGAPPDVQGAAAITRITEAKDAVAAALG
jgi:probable F420-dependent oxidoreductase